MRNLILLFLLSVVSATAQQGVKRNPYQLEIVDNPVVFHQMAAHDSKMLMIDLQAYIPNLVLDIRYATTNNFTGEIIYPQASAFARQPVAEALLNIQKDLAEKGLGLKIFDAYRPYAATLRFYEVYPDTNFVASPWHGSRHNRGAAVDVTLINLETGKALEMPTAFDDFTEKAAPDYQDLPERVKQNRSLLIETMENNGFSVYQSEWWHFDFNGWEQFPLMNLSFDELRSQY
ncbi:MAG: M15 family metallopeptidase [Bacteroidetes bacterium]|jgi:D-alanyl-D-alanine dipeptidase|nr:M15 family metallopeptidase [Bacteroidota bacterium]